MASISYEDACCVYPGAETLAVDSLNLDIVDGEFVVLVGPSGSGKSTALRMLAGLEEIDSGAISIGGRNMVGVAPKDRDIAMVFQNPSPTGRSRWAGAPSTSTRRPRRCSAAPGSRG